MEHRRSIRLKNYDYTEDGAYFVTLLTAQRAPRFGAVVGGEMHLSTLGCMAETCWLAIADHFPGVELDVFVVMPNHLHGIVVLNRWEAATAPGSLKQSRSVRATHASPLQQRPRGPQPSAVSLERAGI